MTQTIYFLDRIGAMEGKKQLRTQLQKQRNRIAAHNRKTSSHVTLPH
jgi:hypothetical protein